MELSIEEFNLFRRHIQQICGMEIRDEKQYLIRQRLEPLVIASGCSSFSEYYHKFLISPYANMENELIISAITTNETSFFRDNHPFETFRNYILPRLAKQIQDRKKKDYIRRGAKVRIWSAGSSTGQEAYSIAILVDEFISMHRHTGISKEDFGIMASDISPVALAKAMVGTYNETEISRGLTDIRLKKYFKTQKNYWTIDESIRSMVEFRVVNLAESFTMIGGFDVIFCRNVLIYFNEDMKSKIFNRFYKILSDEGCLILGATENTYCITDKFQSVRQGETLIYFKAMK